MTTIIILNLTFFSKHSSNTQSFDEDPLRTTASIVIYMIYLNQ